MLSRLNGWDVGWPDGCSKGPVDGTLNGRREDPLDGIKISCPKRLGSYLSCLIGQFKKLGLSKGC